MRPRPLSYLALVFTILDLAISALRADELRVLPAGKLPNDARLGPLKDYNGYFPFTPYTSKDAWEKRAAELRHQILVAAGLWPMPAKTPLRAQVFGEVDRPEWHGF